MSEMEQKIRDFFARAFLREGSSLVVPTAFTARQLCGFGTYVVLNFKDFAHRYICSIHCILEIVLARNFK